MIDCTYELIFIKCMDPQLVSESQPGEKAVVIALS